MTNVVDLPVVTTLPTDPARVLQRALDRGMTEVVVLGFDADGQEYFGASTSDSADVIWHCERAKHKLMRTIDKMASE